MGVVSGCGCKEVYIFPYPYSSCICYFLQQHPYIFIYFYLCFSFLFWYFFVIKLCIKYFFAQYKHTTGIPQQQYEGLHIMFYTQRSTHKRTLHILRWTSAVCLQGVGCRSRSRRRALYRESSQAASFKSRRSRTRRWSQCVLVKIWRDTWNTYLVWRLNIVVR